MTVLSNVLKVPKNPTALAAQRTERLSPPNQFLLEISENTNNMKKRFKISISKEENKITPPSPEQEIFY